MDYYICEECGKRFDEFEMNFRLAQKDKKCLCRECRNKKISGGSDVCNECAREVRG